MISLFQLHPSNFFEQWNTGVRRIFVEARDLGLPEPKIEEIALRLRFTVYLAQLHRIQTGGQKGQSAAQVTAQVGSFCREARSAREIMEMLGLKHWKTFQHNYLNPMLEAGFIERTIPDKLQSRLQKYRLTETGKRGREE